MMLQVAERVWPPTAVHDTVEAVVRGVAFRRTLQNSLAERLVQWLGEWMSRFSHLLRDAPSARAIAIGVAGALVLVIVVRLLVAARARDADALATSRAARAGASQNPWADADRLIAEGRFEEAAHALYHGVLTGVARRERLRLDPSKTSGDYARELRGRGSPSHAAFRAFVRRFDVAVYGYGGCTAESLDELRQLAASFGPAARAA
jgi:hypothetical protein